MAERRAGAVMEAIGALLLDNPWCSPEMVGCFLGLGRTRLGRLADGACFERIRVPAATRRGYQDLYALTAEGASRLAGAHRRPRLLAETLLLAYDRLGRARAGLAEFAAAGRLGWALSPWRPSSRAPYLDALFTLKTAPGRAALLVVAVPPDPAKLDWYVDLLSAWGRWQKTANAHPAALVLWDPPAGPPGRAALAESVPAGPDFPVYFTGAASLAAFDAWQRLAPEDAAACPPRLPQGEEQNLQVARFRFDTRTTPYPRGATLRYWAGRDMSRAARAVTAFWDGGTARIALLQLLARFPALTAGDLALISGRRQGHFWVRSHLEALTAAGLAEVLDGGRNLLTEGGLALLAGLAGVAPKALNRYLGWPVRPGRFRGQEAHLAAAADFMLQLLRQGSLERWSLNSARYTFTLPRPAEGGARRNVHIAPDSAGVLALGRAPGGLFWLEIDRGTRRGRSLTWKLEKYFLAHFSLVAPTRVPPVLYLICGPAGREEQRLAAVGRRLVRLARARPGTALVVLLSTPARLAAVPGRLVEAAGWACFAADRFDPGPVALQTLYMEGSCK